MAIKIKKQGQDDAAGYQVTLDGANDRLGNFAGPTTFFVPFAEGNAEFDDLKRRRDKGEVVVEDFVAPAPAVNPVISKRQFWHAARKLGHVTSKQEALAAMNGSALPAKIATAVGKLPADQREDAELLILGAGEYDLNHPMSGTLAGLMGMTDAQKLELWTLANQM